MPHPSRTQIPLLYLDRHILVCNKPAELLSVPGLGDGLSNNVLSILSGRFPGLRIVHRLDMATSGVLLFARDGYSERNLHGQFRLRQVNKRYSAVVLGKVQQTKGSIDAPVARDWPNRPMQKVCHQQGKWALTHWRFLASRKIEQHWMSMLALWPVTGRSHQLRVHLQSEGMPIVGDRLYNPACPLQPGRTMLHASMLAFCHPVSGEYITIRCPVPQTFHRLWSTASCC